jgi:hypothetical protein
MVITEKNNLGDLLKYEGPNLYSREEVTVASGQNLKRGTVVGAVTTSGLIKQLAPAAEDGTEIAIGIMMDDVDAKSGNTKAVVIMREAIVAHNAVIWPASITAAQKKAAVENLKLYGIIIRKGA